MALAKKTTEHPHHTPLYSRVSNEETTAWPEVQRKGGETETAPSWRHYERNGSFERERITKISIFTMKYYFINYKITQKCTVHTLKAGRLQSHDTGTGSGESGSLSCSVEGHGMEGW